MADSLDIIAPASAPRVYGSQDIVFWELSDFDRTFAVRFSDGTGASMPVKGGPIGPSVSVNGLIFQLLAKSNTGERKPRSL
jgi:hypothetical protein